VATVGGLLAAGTDRLRAAGSPSARLDAELLLAHALGTDRTGVLAHPDGLAGDGPAARFAASLERRAAGEPVAYIRGMKEFHGLALGVDARALVPRPETELLVDLALEVLVDVLGRAPRPAGTSPVSVADVGTGSGAIAVAIAAALRRRGMAGEVEIVASDLSADAAALARENAVAQGVADRVGVVVADLLPPAGEAAGLLRVPDRFDVVCANLPYIRTGDLAGLPAPVRFEPPEALDGGPDGLTVIRRLLALLPDRLDDGGLALVEIGSDQVDAIGDAAVALLPGWGCEVVADLAGLPRIARIARVVPETRPEAGR
jgi:release factor glutamine methyltransferase